MLLLCSDLSQPGWFHVGTYMHVLGLRFANTAGAIKQVRQLLEDHLIMYGFIS